MPRNDVEIFERCGSGGAHKGMKVVKAMALMLETQNEMAIQARRLQIGAERRLAPHTRTGGTRIKVDHGKKVDMYVSLYDQHGAPAPAIEYGRDRGRGGGSRGIYALTGAALFGGPKGNVAPKRSAMRVESRSRKKLSSVSWRSV